MLPNGSRFAPLFLPNEGDDFAQVADDCFQCRDRFDGEALRVGKVVARFQRLGKGTAGCHGMESSTGPCSSVSEVGGQGHTDCGMAVLVAVMAPSTIHVSSSFVRPRRGLRNRGTRTRRIKQCHPALTATAELTHCNKCGSLLAKRTRDLLPARAPAQFLAILVLRTANLEDGFLAQLHQ
jgi:hypothetical protein